MSTSPQPGNTRPADPTVAQRLLRPVLLLAVYTLGISYVDWLLDDAIKVSPAAHAALGTILGLLLVVRTNTAYDRWWEGRKLWGQLVNELRNLAVKAQATVRVDAAAKRDFGRMLVNFARALKEHLRDGALIQHLTMYVRLDEPAAPTHIPLDIALRIRQRIFEWRREGFIDGFEELMFDPHARALMEVCGACERIRRTPVIPSYRAFTLQSIYLYLLTLPWALVDQLGWYAAPAISIIAYFMLGLEVVAEDAAEPFGHTQDDLLLDDICRTLEASIEEVSNKGMTLRQMLDRPPPATAPAASP